MKNLMESCHMHNLVSRSPQACDTIRVKSYLLQPLVNQGRYLRVLKLREMDPLQISTSFFNLLNYLLALFTPRRRLCHLTINIKERLIWNRSCDFSFDPWLKWRTQQLFTCLCSGNYINMHFSVVGVLTTAVKCRKRIHSEGLYIASSVRV